MSMQPYLIYLRGKYGALYQLPIEATRNPGPVSSR